MLICPCLKFIIHWSFMNGKLVVNEPPFGRSNRSWSGWSWPKYTVHSGVFGWITSPVLVVQVRVVGSKWPPWGKNGEKEQKINGGFKPKFALKGEFEKRN